MCLGVKPCLTQNKTDLGFGSLGIRLGLALGALGRGLKGTKTPDLVEDSLGVEFAFETLECAIDGFALTD